VGHGAAVTCVLVVSRLMYTGSADNSAKSWVTEFGDNPVIYKGHEGTVGAVKFVKGLRE